MNESLPDYRRINSVLKRIYAFYKKRVMQNL